MRMPVFDFHCDTALELYADGDKANMSRLRRNGCHIDLERAGMLGGYAQCFALFTSPSFAEVYHRPVEEVFESALKNLLKELADNKDLILPAGSASAVQANAQQGKMSAILTLEGPAGIGFDPGRLEELYRQGFRISTLGWNEQNVLVGSHVTGGGLTDLGKVYVQECQRLGILVDVSHVSDEGFWDIMNITQAPIVATHSNSRSVCNVSRNLTDDMYRAICQTGGTVGINLYTEFVSKERADLDAVCDHIFHFLDLDTSAEHISLGGDLDGCEELSVGFTGIESYNTLSDRLLARGLDEKTLYNLYWNNAMGVMNRAVHINEK